MVEIIVVLLFSWMRNFDEYAKMPDLRLWWMKSVICVSWLNRKECLCLIELIFVTMHWQLHSNCIMWFLCVHPKSTGIANIVVNHSCSNSRPSLQFFTPIGIFISNYPSRSLTYNLNVVIQETSLCLLFSATLLV